MLSDSQVDENEEFMDAILMSPETSTQSSHVIMVDTNKVELKDVVVKLRLSTLKPLHAGWVSDFYNEMTSSKGVELVKSGWRASGIQDAVSLGLEKLPSIDPFEELDPMITGSENLAQSQFATDGRCSLSNRRGTGHTGI